SPIVGKIEQGNLVGAKILDFVVLFSNSGDQSEPIAFNIDEKDAYKILVCDLTAGIWLVKCNNSELGRFKASEEGKCIYFAGNEGDYYLEFLSK
ncbi:MAG: hypothetical protein AAB116_10570, partial [Candidatus Poribacteria bacterium]